MPLTFDPSADPSTVGIITSMVNVLPTVRGVKGAPSPSQMAFAPLEETSRGCATLELLNGDVRAYVGTESYLYEITDGGYVLSGTGFTTGDNRFKFANFGNAVIACNGANALVASTGTSFTGIGGDAPIAKIIESVGLFVLAFDCDDGADHFPDMWWSCALGDYTDWTPSITTQAANGRFLDTPGGVTAAKRMGDGVIAYKKRSMYYGQYVGGDIIWQWSQVAGNAGCVSQDAVVNAGVVHYFVGADDIYMYDGGHPRSIGTSIKRWFFADADQSLLHKTQSHYDRINGYVWFFYCSRAGAGAIDKAIIYSIETGTWGVSTQTIQDVMTFIEPGTTYSDVNGTYDTPVISLSYDNPAWRAGVELPVFFGADTYLYSLTAPTVTASMTLWEIGDGVFYQVPDTVIPRWIDAPVAATMTRSTRNTQGESWAEESTQEMTRWQRFNFRGAYRWNRLALNITGDFELADLSIKLLNRGR